MVGWLFFTAFTAEQRKRDRRRFGHADVDKDGGLSRDKLISMFHPEENPHMFTVIVNVRFRYLCVFLLTDLVDFASDVTQRVVNCSLS